MTARLTAQRARDIIESFGSQAEAWPEQERELLQDYIKHSAKDDPIHGLLAQEQALDGYISQVAPDPVLGKSELAMLQRSILGKLDRRASETVVQADSLLKRFAQTLLQPAWATSVAAGLALAITVSVMYVSSDETVTVANQSSFEAWAWTDVTGDTSSRELVAVNNPKNRNSTLGAIAQFEPDLEIEDF